LRLLKTELTFEAHKSRKIGDFEFALGSVLKAISHNLFRSIV
jgi:hypothetical protein